MYNICYRVTHAIQLKGVFGPVIPAVRFASEILFSEGDCLYRGTCNAGACSGKISGIFDDIGRSLQDDCCGRICRGFNKSQ